MSEEAEARERGWAFIWAVGFVVGSIWLIRRSYELYNAKTIAWLNCLEGVGIARDYLCAQEAGSADWWHKMIYISIGLLILFIIAAIVILDKIVRAKH